MSESNSPPNQSLDEIRSANTALKSVDEAIDRPLSVYRSVLSAHKSLCAALDSVKGPTDGKIDKEDKADSIREDIKRLEDFASLLAADQQALQSLQGDSPGTSSTLSESEQVQIEDFLEDAHELLLVTETNQLDSEPLRNFTREIENRVKGVESGDPTEDELLAHVEQLAEQLQRVPSYKDVRRSGEYRLNAFYERFDSWTAAIEATKIDHRTAFLEDIDNVGENLGKQPTSAEYNAHGEYSLSRIERTFGTWTDALNQSSIDPPTDQELCDEIEVLADELGRIPTARQMDDDGRFGSHTYTDRFGSWMAAIDATSLNHREEVITDLQTVATSLGHPPTTTEMEKQGIYSPNDVYKHFETWEEAKETIELSGVGTEETTTKRERMIASLEELAADLGRIPNGSHMNARGDFEQHEITTEFGSWHEAIEATDLDIEKSFMEEVRRIAKEVESPPTIPDLSTHSGYGPNDFYRHFDSWLDLRDKAGVSTQAEVDALLNQETPSTGDSTSASVSPSELAERYEVFLQLSRTVHRIVEYTESRESESPLFRWRGLLSQFLSSGLDDWEAGYGPQQGERSPFSIEDYRDVYGNGEQVTDFQLIETVSIDPVIGALFESIDGLEVEEELYIPVAPETGEPLPVFVETETELDYARDKLAEFPEKPEVDQWEWSEPQEREDSETDAGEDVEETVRQSESAIEELCTVAGIEEAEAEILSAADIKSVHDLRQSTIEELVEIEGITEGLAFRMKADVGGT